jgi:hypothetical protein
MKALVLLLASVLLSLPLPAQREELTRTIEPRYYVGVSGQYGFLWSHRYNMGHLVKQNLTTFEVDVWKTADGTRSWHRAFHFPGAGIALHYIPLGNPDQLGNAIGIYPFVNFPLGKYKRNFKLHMRYGWGIGWLTKSFDPLENHKNIAIGSHLNTCFSLRLNGMWTMGNSSYLELGLGITHFSNGAARLPNLGINLPMVSVGYHFKAHEKYNPATRVPHDYKGVATDSLLATGKWHISALLVLGANDIDPPGGNRFGVANVLTYMMKQASRKHRFGGGIDVMYSQAIHHKVVYDSIDVNAGVAGAMQPGVKFCYELVLGRVSLPGEFGVYLYSKYKENGPIYNRFGIRYLAGEHVVLNFTLKTHFAKAEYWETGIGWRF